MAIGAHADDIEFNAGGTLSKYRALGYDVSYVMSTNNMSGSWNTIDADGKRHYRLPPYDEIMPQRKKEAEEAAAYYGTTAIHLDHPQRHFTRKDGKVENLCYGSERPDCVPPQAPTIITAHETAECVTRLADLILELQPEAIVGHGLASGNIEHMGSFLLVTKAYNKARTAGYQGMLLYWMDIDRGPLGDAYRDWDSFIDVSDHWAQKMEALALHACQIPDLSTLTFPDHGPACNCRHAELFILGEKGETAGAPFSDEIRRNLRKRE